MKKISALVEHIRNAEAIVVGGGSGMSNASGMDFWYSASPLFKKYMKNFYDRYHFEGLFNGFYSHFASEEERWAFALLADNMVFNIPPQKPTYEYLKKILKDKPFHIITTNIDGLFKKYFSEDKVSEIQGSFYFFQSTDTSTDKNLYPVKPYLEKLIPKIENNRLPRKYFPTSPINGAQLKHWARSPEFLEDKKYNEEYQKISRFLGKYKDKKVLFLEMGVGRMTPMFIQEPFWELTHYLPRAFYVNVNPKDAVTNPEIQDKSLLISEDINEVLKQAAQELDGGTND